MTDLTTTDLTTTDLTTTDTNNNWFTLVDEKVQDQILSGVQGTAYQPSPFRKLMTGQSTFFSWGKPGAQAAEGATLPPEITDSVVGLRGYIVHYGSRLSLFDSANKKQLCGSVSTVINYDEKQNPILSKNTYPIPASIYGCTAFGEELQASPIIENFEVRESEDFKVDEDENTLSVLNRYIDDSEFNFDKSIIKNILQDLYQQASQIE
jgi:hypothetical protein